MRKLLCPKCGSKNIEPLEDKVFKLGRETQQYICNDCNEITSLVIEKEEHVSSEMEEDLTGISETKEFTAKKGWTSGSKVMIGIIVVIITLFLVQNYSNRVTIGHYENSEYGFAFDYAPLWKETTSDYLVKFDDPGNTAGFFISYGKLQVNTSLEEYFQNWTTYIKDSRSSLSAWGYDSVELIDAEDLLIAGKEAYVYSVKTYSNEYSLRGKFRTYYVPKDNDSLFVITYLARESAYEASLDDFMVTINSFEIS